MHLKGGGNVSTKGGGNASTKGGEVHPQKVGEMSLPLLRDQFIQKCGWTASSNGEENAIYNS
jgi:hypothetical protein